MAVEAVDPRSGQTTVYRGDWFFSTMPVKELVRALDAEVPAEVRQVSEGLIYRDFITVGLLLKELKVREDSPQGQQLIRDNWIYIQEPDVLVGRLQIFNNWSPYMVADPSKVWVGLEYFCYESDDLWKMSDQELIELGGREMEKIGIIERSAVLDATVIRMPKTYPAYFGTYDRFDEVRRLRRSLRESLPAGPQRHAPLQQPGPFDAHGHGGGRQYRRRSARQVERLGREHRAGLSRGEGFAAGKQVERARVPDGTSHSAWLTRSSTVLPLRDSAGRRTMIRAGGSRPPRAGPRAHPAAAGLAVGGRRVVGGRRLLLHSRGRAGRRRFRAVRCAPPRGMAKPAGRKILLLLPHDSRIVEIGAVRSFEQMCRSELDKRGIPPADVWSIRAEARDVWDEAHAMADWLKEHPGATVVLACSPFGSGRLRYVFNKVLGPADAAAGAVGDRCPTRNAAWNAGGGAETA